MKPRPEAMDIEETVLDEMLRGHRARAMLIHLRHYGGGPHDAWHALSGLVETNYDSPDQDPQVHRVERYLEGRDSRKNTLIWFAGILAVFLIGALIAARGWPRMMVGVDSYSWPEVAAGITDVKHYEITEMAHHGQVVKRYIDYRYEYTVGSKTYAQTVRGMRYSPVLDGPAPEIGDGITVVYNPDDHAAAIHHREMYDRAMPVGLGALIMLPPVGLLLLLGFFEFTHRDLQRHDPAVRERVESPAVRAVASL